MNNNLKPNQLVGVMLTKNVLPPIGNQPPKNKTTIRLHAKIILRYSAKKKNTNPTEEYSTLYPETNSDSASGKSKGTLLVSAKQEIKKSKNEGNITAQKNISLCASTIQTKFKDCEQTKIGITVRPIETS